jgi:hypothetical protein
LPSKSDTANNPDSQPPDLFSSVETRAMLEEFRELVRAGILRVTPENEVLPAGGSSEQQSETAPSREEEVALLDRQLLEWLESRREQKSHGAREEPTPSSEAVATISGGIRQKVIERVAQKVIESWERSGKAGETLREQIVDQIVEDVLRRLRQKLE